MNIDNVGERKIKAPPRAIMVNRGDNVAVVLGQVQAGDEVVLSADWIEVAIQNIPPGHKMAIYYVRAGEPVIKSGEVIGIARRPIRPGEYVHVHNLKDA